MDIPGVIVSQIAYMRLPFYTAVDRPGLEPGKSSAYEADALTNCANDPFAIVASSLCLLTIGCQAQPTA